MLRILLFALAIGVTLYAILDWGFTSKRQTPGGISRWVWLAVILLVPILGPTTWVILRLVGDAEGRQEAATEPMVAPDDDPEFLSDISKRIQRRQRRTTEAPPTESEDS